MSIVTHNLILAGQYSFLQKPADNPVPATSPEMPPSGAWFVGPIVPVGASDVTTYDVIAEAINGTPTSITLAAKFQSYHSTTQGSVNTSYFTDARPAFFDVTDSVLLPDGNWPADLVAGFTSALATAVAGTKTEISSSGGLRHTRRIRGPHRILFMPTIVGGAGSGLNGTNPGVRLTVSLSTDYGV